MAARSIRPKRSKNSSLPLRGASSFASSRRTHQSSTLTSGCGRTSSTTGSGAPRSEDWANSTPSLKARSGDSRRPHELSADSSQTRCWPTFTDELAGRQELWKLMYLLNSSQLPSQPLAAAESVPYALGPHPHIDLPGTPSWDTRLAVAAIRLRRPPNAWRMGHGTGCQKFAVKSVVVGHGHQNRQVRRQTSAWPLPPGKFRADQRLDD